MTTSIHPSRHHLAVVDGPDVGWYVPVPERGAVLVGRGPDCDLQIADPALSRTQLEVAGRRGRLEARRRGAGRVTVRRGRRSRRGQTRLGRRRRLGRRARALTPGSTLRAGATVLQLREHPGLAPRVAPAPTGHGDDGSAIRLLLPLAMAAGTLPLLLSSSSSSPWRMLVWVLLPVVMIAAVLAPRWRRRRARRAHPPRDDASAPPAPPPAPLDPAGVMVASAPPGEVETVRWDVGRRGGRARRTPHPRRPTPARTIPAPVAGRGVAVVGPAPAARAMARWLLVQQVRAHDAEDLAVTVPPSWRWAAPLPHVGGRPGDRGRLLVVDRTARDQALVPPVLARTAHALVVATSLADVPAWCTDVVEVGAGHDRLVGELWAAEAAAGLAAGARGEQTLPTTVPLAELLAPRSPEAVAAGWAGSSGLAAPLGRTEDGPWELDLETEGPHALVAGTTGSGKSELLTTWLLGLAQRYPPAGLQLLLVDYKGGATFASLTDLPHVVGMLTDLDGAATARALASLRAEVARRERLLAERGARTLAELRERHPTDAVARLLVMVDEFRTMADAHPELLDGLVRLAAQGRTLGVHLVLATQRPAGAVTADMRANLSARLCLRVLEDGDAVDVVGDARAARLPAIPGRAVVRTAGTRLLQAAWAGTPDDVAARVVTIRAAAATAADQQLTRVSPPWAPPLPARVEATALDRTGAGLALLRTDEPARQRLGTWALPVEPPGSLLVGGPPRSGRTTTAVAVGVQALRAGLPVHLVATDATLPDAPARGTVCDPADPVRLLRLLSLLTSGPTTDPALLVLDDVDEVCAAVDGLGGQGEGRAVVAELLRQSRRRGLTVVLTDGAASRWAPHAQHHLVLAPRDVTDAVVAGVPRELAGSGWPPGRGVLLGGPEPLVAHVALPDGSVSSWPSPTRPPLRLRVLPDRVGPVPPPHDPRRGVLGVGGDDARPVSVGLGPGAVVLLLGSVGSGRTTTLRSLAAQLAGAGRTVTTDPGAATAGCALLLDDVERCPPPVQAAAAAALARGATVVAAARPEPLAGDYGELARRLREADAVVVIGSPPGLVGLLGPSGRVPTDPCPRVGRAVLLAGGTTTPVQLAVAPGEAHRAQRTVSLGEDGRLVAAIEEGSSSATSTSSDTTTAG